MRLPEEIQCFKKDNRLQAQQQLAYKRLYGQLKRYTLLVFLATHLDSWGHRSSLHE